MGRTALIDIEGSVENTTILNAVTVATIPTGLDLTLYRTKTIYVYVSGNTGAVTVNIESSSDNTNWANIKSTTYTVKNTNDSYETSMHHPYMRVTTTSHTNATVTSVITGRT